VLITVFVGTSVADSSDLTYRNRFLGTGSKICYPVPQTGTRNRFMAS